MCLLVNQSKIAPALPDARLLDMFERNSDGVGVMYHDATAGALIVKKELPTDGQGFVDFYRAHIQGRACAFHLRMKTHGNIDLINCHPYQIFDARKHGLDMYLMHNGVLSTGNARDRSKSDTWHYIRDYLRPMLSANPSYAFTDSFRALIGAHIGANNKFIIMDSLGRHCVINRASGVYWGGLWLSNTYAWTAPASASKSRNKKLKRADLIKQVQAPIEEKRFSYYRGASTGAGAGAGYISALSWNTYDDYYYDVPARSNKTTSTPAITSTPAPAKNQYALVENYLPDDIDASDAYYAQELLNEVLLEGYDVKANAIECARFISEYGDDEFNNLIDSLLYESITPEWFDRAIKNPRSVAVELGLTPLIIAPQ